MHATLARLFIRWSRHQDTRILSGRASDHSRRSWFSTPWQLWVFWILLLVGTLTVASSLFPAHPAPTPVTGNGGPMAPRFCGSPLQVVQHFGVTNGLGLPYTAATLPTATQLATLPTPTANGQVFYEPQFNVLCAVSAPVLQSALQSLAVSPMTAPTLPNGSMAATPIPTVPTTGAPPSFSSGGSTNLWAQGAMDALSGVWNGFYHWAGQTLQYIEDWATETLGFLWVTPDALTYNNGVVQTGLAWMLGLMNGLLMLILVLGGYQCMIRTMLGEPRQEVLAFLVRVLITAVVANVASLYLIPQLIELNNTLCAGSIQVFVHAGVGDFKIPFLGGLNWLQQPLSWSLFLLIGFVISLLLILSLLVRLPLFIVCYILAPVGILLMASGFGRGWGQLWCRLFFYSLFIQFLQVLVVAIGSALSTNFLSLGSQGSLSPTTLFVGIAALYLAFKLPQILLLPVVGAAYQDAAHGLTLASTISALLAA
jgi:hypothetical protein